MYCLKTSASFDSAHFLAGYEGKCSNIHGHRWTVEVVIRSSELCQTGAKRGMLIDFGDFKHIVRELSEEYDHALIYEENSLKPSTVEALISENFRLIQVKFRPTAENFAKHFFDILKTKGLPIYSVTVYETPENCAVYKEEE